MAVYRQAIRLGQMATFTDDFEQLVGRTPMSVRDVFEHMDEHLSGARIDRRPAPASCALSSPISAADKESSIKHATLCQKSGEAPDVSPL